MFNSTARVAGVRFAQFAVPALVALLAGCGPQVLDFRNAEISNGKMYAEKANEPFTGKVTNVPLTRLPINGVKPVLTILSNVTKDPAYQGFFMANALAAILGKGGSEGGVLCDASFENGQLHGPLACAAGGQPLLKVAYEGGTIDGNADILDPRQDGALAARGPYSKGKLDGDVVIYDTKSGKKIGLVQFKDGVLHGKENVWNTQGDPTFKATLINGLYDGEMVHVVDGKETRSEWKAGVKLVAAAPAAPAPTPAPTAADACLDLWIAAFRKEAGEDAAIKSDIIEEWQGMCKEGKKPGSS